MIPERKKRSSAPIFIFDLDNTLLDTDRLARFCASRVLRSYGVTTPMFQAAREYEKKHLRGRQGYATIARIFHALEIVAKRRFPKIARRRFAAFMRQDTHRFFYRDVFKILPSFPGKKILLTRGNCLFQMMKLQHPAVRRLFHRLLVTQRLKTHEIQRISARADAQPIILVDDAAEEHHAALREHPALFSVHIIRRGSRHKPIAHQRCFVVQNLKQLERIIPKILELYERRRRKN